MSIRATLAAVVVLAVLSLLGANAGAASYYFDVNGTTSGFGTPTLSGTYTESGTYWNSSSAGTGTPAAFVSGGNMTFGATAGDSSFSGSSFTINMDGNPHTGITVNSIGANITLIGTANAYENGASSWYVQASSTLNVNVPWSGSGMNFNNQVTTFTGGGLLNFQQGMGNNSSGLITQSMTGGTVKLGLTSGTPTFTGGYTLTAGTLLFSTTYAIANQFKNFAAGKNFTINGGTIDNTSGSAATLVVGSGSYSIGGDFTFAGSNNLNLGTAGVTLGTAVRAITVSANTLTMGGAVSGAGGGITKLGNGTLLLGGSNSYTGGTTVSAGALIYSSSNSKPASGSTTVAASATLGLGVGGAGYFQAANVTSLFDNTLSGVTMNATSNVGVDTTAGNFTYSDTITGSPTKGLVKYGANTLAITGTNTYTGGTTINAGTLSFGNGALSTTGNITMNGGTLQWATGNTQDISSRLALVTGATATLDTNGNNVTLSTSLNNTGATLAKNGAGTLTLGGGANVKNLTLNAGTLDLTGDLTLNNTGSAGIGGTGGTINATGGGRIVLTGGTAGNYTDMVGTTTINAQITGAYGIDFYNSGTFTLANANNNFTGSVDLFGTAVSVAMVGNSGSASPLGTNGTIVFGYTTGTGNLIYTGTGETTDKVINLYGTTGGATIDQSGSGLLKFTANLTSSNTGAKTMTLQGSTAGTGEIAGIIVDSSVGATAVTKAGSGAWTISGANTYTGATTVSAGTLTIQNRTAASGAITVAGAGATLNLGAGNNFAMTSGNAAFMLGNNADGIVTQSSGTISLGTAAGNMLLVGNGSSGTGTYNLTGGTLKSSTASSTRGVMLGVNTGANGVFNLSGSGVLDLATNAAQLAIGRQDSAAGNSNNVYNQTGGTATVGYLALGGGAANITSSMTITGGTFQANNFQTIASNTSNVANIYLGSGAQVTLPAFPTTRGTGATATMTLDFTSGGYLAPYAASTTYLQGMDHVYLTANGANFNVASGKDITVAQNLEDAAGQTGTLTKIGVGTLTLTGTNIYTGATTISAGILQPATTASLPGWDTSGKIVVNGGTVGVIVGGSNWATADVDTLLTNATKTSGYLGIDTTNGSIAQSTWNFAAGLGNLGINKLGANTLTMDQANSYTGGTIITSGTVQVMGANTALGTGNVTFAGAACLQAGDDGRNLANNIATGGNAVTIDTQANNLTLGGTISGGGSLTKTGAGTLTLAGANTYSGTTNVSGGTLKVTGGTLGNGTATNRLLIGYNGTSGAFIQNGGLLNIAPGTPSADDVSMGGGTSGYGYYLMQSGTLLTGQIGVGASTASGATGVMEVTGGKVVASASIGTGWIVFGWGNAADNNGILTIKGGSVTNNSTGNDTGMGFRVGQNSLGMLSVVGSGTFDATGGNGAKGGIDLGVTAGAANFGGYLNINGGRVITNYIKATNTNTPTFVNFGGGTLASHSATTTFLQGVTAATLYDGGATIDTTGGDVTIAQNLLAPGANGITAIALSNSGAGYIGAPAVRILGSGTGASAIANVDTATGLVTGITVTSPGWGYTGSTTVNIIGGGYTSSATAGTVSTGTPTSGGLTKVGSGNLTLSGSNNYTGVTTVSSGTLTLARAGNSTSGTIVGDLTIGSAGTVVVSGNQGLWGWGSNQGNLTINGGTLTDGSATGEVDLGNVTLNGGTISSSGTGGPTWGNWVFQGSRTVTVTASSTINASKVSLSSVNSGITTFSVDNGQTLMISSALINGGSTGTGLNKTGAGNLTLSGSNTYTGLTTVSLGTLTLQGVALSTTARTYGINSGATLILDGTGGVVQPGPGTSIFQGSGTLQIQNGQIAQSATTGGNKNITMSLGAGSVINIASSGTLTNGGWQNITWTSNLASMNVNGVYDVWDGNTTYIDALTGSGTIDKKQGTGTVTLVVGDNGGSGNFSGVIKSTSNTLTLTKTGAGTQTLSGANTYTGITTISGGVLSANTIADTGSSSIGLSALAGALTFGGSGGTLNFTGATGTTARAIAFTGQGTFDVAAGSTLTIGSAGTASATSGAWTGSGGGVKTGLGTLTIRDNSLQSGRTTNLVFNNTNGGTFTMQSGTLNLAPQGTAANSHVIIGDAAAGTFNQTGGTTIFSPSNSSSSNIVYVGITSSGTMNISGGTFIVDAAKAGAITIGRQTSGVLNIGGGAGIATVDSPLVNVSYNVAASNGTLNLLTNGVLLTSKLAYNGTTYTGNVNFDGGTLKVKSSNTAFMPSGFTSAVITANGLTVDTNSYNITIAQALSGASGELTKAGGGVLTLSGSNSYGGGTNISAGALAVSNANALGTGPVNFTASGTLQAGSTGLTVANPIGLDFNSGTIDTLGNALTLSGSISGIGGSLVKLGTGALTLAGNNTYTGGTTIQSGTLRAGSDTALGTGTVDLKAGTMTTDGTARTLGNDISYYGGILGNTGNTSLLTLNSLTLGSSVSVNTASDVAFTNGVYGGYTLTKTGAGTLYLSGTDTVNQWAGGTVATQGMIVFASNAATGLHTLGANVRAVNAVLGVNYTGVQGFLNGVVNGAGSTNGVIAISSASGGENIDFTSTGNGVMTTGYLGALSGNTVNYTGNLTPGTAGDYRLGGGGGTLIYTPAITGSSSVTVGGANGGVVALTNNNTYSGVTTINTGILQINAASNLGNGSATNTITLGAATLESTANTYDLGANRNITLTGAGKIQNDDGTLTVSGNIANGGNGLTISGAGNSTFTGVIGTGSTPTGGLTINSTGTVTLAGNNLFTGGINLSNGNTVHPTTVVVLTNSGAFGVGAKTVTDGGGNEIHLQNNITLASGISLNLSGDALWNDSGNNTINGNITNTSGDGSLYIHSTSDQLTLNGSYTANTTSRSLGLYGAGNITINGVIGNGSTTNLPVTIGAGDREATTGTFTLSGSNTYGGKTSVRSGVLSIASINSVTGGSAGSNLGHPTTVANGTIDLGDMATDAKLIYTGAGETTDRVINMPGATGGAILDQSGSGLLKFTSPTTITGVGARTVTLQGSTAGIGEIAGAIVDSANSYSTVLSGTTVVGSSTITLAYAGAFSVGASVTGAGIDNATTVSAINLSTNQVTLSSPTIAQIVSGTVTFGSGSGATSLVKTGTGMWILSGNNTYSGDTTINGGNLKVNGSLNSSGNVYVNSGGTLSGTGSVGNVTVSSGGILAAGNSVGTQTMATLTLGAGSILEVEFNNTPANDQWVISGTNGLTINGGALKLWDENTTNTFSTAGTYQLIQYAGNIGGSISNLSIDPSTQVVGKTYQFGTSGGWVTLSILDYSTAILSLSNSTQHLNMLKNGTIDLSAYVKNAGSDTLPVGDDMAYTLTGDITGSGTLSHGVGEMTAKPYSQANYGSFNLSVTANAANVHLSDAIASQSFGMTIVAGEATAGNGAFNSAYALYSKVASGGSYANLASKVTAGPAAKLGSEAIITAGTAGADRLVSMNWRTRTNAEMNGPGAPLPSDAFNLVSDVVELAGASPDTVTLKVSYDAASLVLGRFSEDYLAGNNKYGQQWIYLAELVGGAWTKVAGSQTVNTTDHWVTATITHDGTYAVVPEPGTMALLLVGGVGVLLRRRRKA